MSKDALSKILNMDPLVPAATATVSQTPAGNNQFEIDAEKARKNIEDAMAIAAEAADTLSQIADSSQNHNDYKALASILKTQLDASRELMMLHRDKKEVKQDGTSVHANNVNHNTIYVGSTAELQKYLANKSDGSDSKS